MRTPVWFLLALALVLGGAIWWLSSNREPPPHTPPLAEPTPTVTPEPLPSPAPTAAHTSAVRYEIPSRDEPAAEPLPPLSQSDALFRERLFATAGGPQPLERWLMPNALIQRIVVTLDSLDQSLPIALRMRPLAHVPGLFQATQGAQTLQIHADNARRYDAYVDLFATIDPRQLATLYFGLYPLFQAAYEEIGYDGHYFNDRVVDLIDHLLDTPELAEAPALVRPKVQYRYADADTEARSWGQKTLIRMGRDHQWRVKAQLRALRAELIGQPPPPPPSHPAPDEEHDRAPTPPEGDSES